MNGTSLRSSGCCQSNFDLERFSRRERRWICSPPVDLAQERHWGSIVALFGRLKPGVSIAQAREDGLRIGPSTFHDVTQP